MKFNVIALSCAILFAVGLSLSVGAGPIVDSDNDGVTSALDNCTDVGNPSQCDVDLDGYGNHCDGDFDQNLATGASDFNLFRAANATVLGQPAYDPNIDMDCNNAIGATDFKLFRDAKTLPPGPSGLLCAGVVACSAF